MRDCAEIEDWTDSLLLGLYHNKSWMNFFPSPIQAVKDIWLSAKTCYTPLNKLFLQHHAEQIIFWVDSIFARSSSTYKTSKGLQWKKEKENITNTELCHSQFQTSKEAAYGACWGWQTEHYSARVYLTLAKSMLHKVGWSLRLNGNAYFSGKARFKQQ